MIESLSEIRMRQYIELVCGDLSVLKNCHEVIRPGKLEETRRRLMYEFARISDESAARGFVMGKETKARAHAETLLFSVLNNLLAIGAVEEVRGILREYGIASGGMSADAVAAEVKRLLKRAQTNEKREEAKEGEEETEVPDSEVRMMFERQAAYLMTYFKFQIDLDGISAAAFAYMAEQARRETKTRLSAFGK